MRARPSWPGSERPLELGGVLRILWRGRIVIGLLMLIGGALGVGLARLQEPVYRAEALVIIGRDVNAGPVGGVAEVPPEWLVATERDILVSRSMLEDALARLGTPPPRSAGSPAAQIEAWVRERLGADAPPPAPPEPPSLPEQVEQVAGGLTVFSTPGSLGLTVQHSSPSAEFSTRIVNALVEAYIAQKTAAVATARQSAIEGVEERLLYYAQSIGDLVEDMTALMRQPDAQISLQRRRQEFDALQQILQELELQRERLALTPSGERVWFVSPATVPREPVLATRRLTVAAGVLLPAGLAALVLIVAARLSSARRRAAPPRALGRPRRARGGTLASDAWPDEPQGHQGYQAEEGDARARVARAPGVGATRP